MANKGMRGLLAWCKKHTEGYNDVNVINMSSSWKDGLAFCALIHRFRPDLIDFNSLSKENVLYNNQLAFGIAEKELGIAALLDAEDMANMVSPDRLSVMTYVSQYYSCFRHCEPKENVSSTEAPVVNPANTSKPSPVRRSTDESICYICGKRVHLVQRYFENGQLYHRTCHRKNSLQKLTGENYFIKSQTKGLPTTDMKNGVRSKGMNEDHEQPREKDMSSKAPQRPEMNLPNLVESLGDAKVQAISITTSTPSPMAEEKRLPNVAYTDAPAFVSELPKSAESGGDIKPEEGVAIPKPRTRSMRPSSDDTKAASAPIARPRSKSPVVPDIPAEEVGNEYDKELNPFASESGSDSDTTLSSTSSDDDEMNPFASASNTERDRNVIDDAKIKQNAAKEKDEVHEEEGYGNPFGDDDETDDDEGGNPFGDDELEEAGVENDDECGNPFGEAEKEEVIATPPVKSVRYRPERTNPFSSKVDEEPKSTNSADSQQKKKRLAPVPPKSAPQLTTSKDVTKPKPSPHKKAPAPPPPSWKHDVSQKMAELNRTNEKDPKYKQHQSPKFQRPQSGIKSPASHLSPKRDYKVRKGPSPKTRAAPGYGHPLVKRKVEVKMSEEEITTELKLLDVKLNDYETKGIKLEELLRFAMNNDTEWTKEEDDLLQEWFELVNKKNILLRQESDLVFQMQQQKLEQEHADIEFQLRKLLNKPDSAKTDQDKIEEEKLLQKLVEVVERRNVIINSIEEERIKEVEEDTAYEQMKRLQKNPSKKKKKNKVKKIFSKKDKSRKDKKDSAIKDTQS